MDVRHIEIAGRVTGWATRLCSVKGCHRLVEWPSDEPSRPVCLECWDAAVDAGDEPAELAG